MPERRIGRWPWGLLAVLVSLVPAAGLFTTSRIFYVRDLSFFFWSRHLWLRRTIFGGHWPWWDPYVASGQSAIADALNQLMMPVALAARLLPSDVVSFNIWVAVPLPIAALGMFVFLRRLFARAGGNGHIDAAAAFGAAVFSLSGPVVSSLNLPNLAWSIAFIPWVLAGESVIWIAIAFALQALCGEPVTWIATGVLEAAWIGRNVRLLAALPLGALLASAQLVPTALASVRAHRAAIATPDFWSLHPLVLWEALAPNLFGNYYDAFLADLPWMGFLNFGRDPFFYSLYVGPLVLLLAAAAARQARRNAFWIAVAVLFILAACGGYTPFYPWLRRLLPPLLYFRFPAKYIVFAAFAVAVLAADGWRVAEAGEWGRPHRLAWGAGIAGGVVVAATLALMGTDHMYAAASHLATVTHLEDVAAGADAFARAAPPLALRAGAMLVAAALLVALAAKHHYAWALLAAITCADLLAVAAGLNPTLPVEQLTPPAWFTAASSRAERLYIGGRVRGYMNAGDPDAVSTWHIPAESTAVAGRMELNAELPMAPSGWRVREALSYDLPYLWPAEYEQTVRRFERASRAERDAFLRRTGVRWCVVNDAQQRPWRAVAAVPDWNMRVYECHPDASRLAFAAAPGTLEDLFTPDRADGEDAGEAQIVDDAPNRVVVAATVHRDTYLVLRDSFDPSWRAEVDGQPAPIVRAFGIQRAVALAAGRHLVRFVYRPRELFIGLTLSVMGIIGLAVAGRAGWPRPLVRRRDDGFTLIELMIVLAIIGIVLAIAFTEYRNMQARGNEASALSSMRSIAAAQWQFATTCGHMKYAATLPALAQPVPSTGEAFLSPDLTSGETIEKSGYVIRMTGKPLDDAPPACNGAPVAAGYAATADPVKPGVSGAWFYAVNADRVLYLDQEKSFEEDLPESGAPPHGAEVK